MKAIEIKYFCRAKGREKTFRLEHVKHLCFHSKQNVLLIVLVTCNVLRIKFVFFNDNFPLCSPFCERWENCSKRSRNNNWDWFARNGFSFTAQAPLERLSSYQRLDAKENPLRQSMLWQHLSRAEHNLYCRFRASSRVIQLLSSFNAMEL